MIVGLRIRVHVSQSGSSAIGTLLAAASIDRASGSLLFVALLLLRGFVIVAVTLADTALLARSAVLTALDLPLSADKATSSTTPEFGPAGGAGTTRDVTLKHHTGAKVRSHTVTDSSNCMGGSARSTVRVAISTTACG